MNNDRKPLRPSVPHSDKHSERVSWAVTNLRNAIFYGEVKAHTHDMRGQVASLSKENRKLRKRCAELHKQVIDLLAKQEIQNG